MRKSSVITIIALFCGSLILITPTQVNAVTKPSSIDSKLMKVKPQKPFIVKNSGQISQDIVIANEEFSISVAVSAKFGIQNVYFKIINSANKDVSEINLAELFTELGNGSRSGRYSAELSIPPKHKPGNYRVLAFVTDTLGTKSSGEIDGWWTVVKTIKLKSSPPIPKPTLTPRPTPIYKYPPQILSVTVSGISTFPDRTAFDAVNGSVAKCSFKRFATPEVDNTLVEWWSSAKGTRPVDAASYRELLGTGENFTFTSENINKLRSLWLVCKVTLTNSDGISSMTDGIFISKRWNP